MIPKNIRHNLRNFKFRLLDPSFENTIWLINLIPKTFGFYVLGDRINVIYWTIHVAILFYIYFTGCVAYQIIHAGNFLKTMTNYVNVFIFVLTANITYWFLSKRKLLKAILETTAKSDQLADTSKEKKMIHANLMKKMKYLIIGYLVVNFTDDFLYQSQRLRPNNDFSIVNCVGISPLTSSPHREICTALLMLQECTLLFVVSNYHVIFLFLSSHTVIMFRMLTIEMMEMGKFTRDYDKNLRERICTIVKRHILILKTVKQMKALYSMPLGIDFCSDAVCMCLVQFVPIEEFPKFIFVLVYCSSLFFLYCSLGQRLTTESERFERAVYLCGWENIELKEQKIIFQILRQAQKPVKLLAADFVPVNLYTFASTCQTIYKFVTVMKF